MRNSGGGGAGRERSGADNGAAQVTEMGGGGSGLDG